MKREWIKWKEFCPLPGEFPCTVCGTRDAEYFVYLPIGNTEARIPVCEDCAELSKDEMLEKFRMS